MPLCLHCICAQLAFDCRLGENVRVIVLIQHIVGNVLNDCRRLFIIDQLSRFDDKLFRIVLKLVKDSFLNPGEDLHNSFPCQPCLAHQLPYKIILDAAVGTNALASVIGGGSRL